MNAAELEMAYLGCIRRKSSLLLLSSDDTLKLLAACSHSEVRFLGIEAFRLFPDGGVQPAMEFSNISFGTYKDPQEEFEFKRELRTPWNVDPAAIEHSMALVKEGTANGFSWYEVSLEDPTSGELLFFRSIQDGV